ncbi:PLP-dependent aminotransferase family protein [Methylobacter sp. BlB1]|uniref:aminotransferase-like domain-containing protein n=1 Tax=Methylobacter sp. BlB1 TaxID=2785914 RepID=UPI001893A252|nr:PLP-dependent aminotransferase family protein [Methylobacter sp. BlB1]MBF6651098.1 PLP-dependent aminotransferase family protein [Methylobacter sp. BlB1]
MTYEYQKVCDYVCTLIHKRQLREDMKLPSLRKMAEKFDLSIPTIHRAYCQLEKQGIVRSKPRSGFYIAKPAEKLTYESSSSLLEMVYVNSRKPGVIPLTIDSPSCLLSFDRKLRAEELQLSNITFNSPLKQGILYGDSDLRAAVAHRYTSDLDNSWDPSDVFITDSYHSSLLAAAKVYSQRRGSAIVESPCSWAIIKALETLNLNILELPVIPGSGLNLTYLISLLSNTNIAFAILSSHINSPTGTAIPVEQKYKVACLFTQAGIPIIENDIYGDLYFGDEQPLYYRDIIDPEQLIICSSFDKIIGPPASFGMILCKNGNDILRKILLSHTNKISSPTRQKAIGNLISNGQVMRNIYNLRNLLKAKMLKMHDLLQKYLPLGCSYHLPQGGAVFWVKLPEEVDSSVLLERLMKKGIVVAPGHLFSSTIRYANYIRISYATDWTMDIEKSINCLAEDIKVLIKKPSRSVIEYSPA